MGRLSRRIAKLEWESYRVVGQVGRPSWGSLNRPDGDWPHESRSSPAALLGERWDRERNGGSDCSVNFILPQLRGRQGERTSLAPRPRRPTFLSGENETADRERAILQE